MRLLNRMLVIIALGLALGVGHSMLHFVRFPNQPIRTELRLDAPVEPVPVAPAAAAPAPGSTGPAASVPAVPEGENAARSASPDPAAAQPATGDAPLGLNITIAQAYALYQRGGIIFLDSRRKDEYEEGHVDGSLHLSTEHFGRGSTPVTIGVLDKNTPVVVYCGGGACDASKNLVIMLQNFGFTRFHIMTDGFPAWQQAGHPVAKGPSPVNPEEAM